MSYGGGRVRQFSVLGQDQLVATPCVARCIPASGLADGEAAGWGNEVSTAGTLRPSYLGTVSAYTTSMHHYLTEAIDLTQPHIIIEIGVWKGASTLTMARHAGSLGLDCTVIAIDTWLGSAEHMTGKNTKIGLPRKNGFPTIYFTFLSNCVHFGQRERVVPLPLDSVNACEVIKHHGIRADIIHIDAGHDYRSVRTDIGMWWPILRPGGIMLGDDYYTDNDHWPGVRQAFDEAFKGALQHAGGKCRVRKSCAPRTSVATDPVRQPL